MGHQGDYVIQHSNISKLSLFELLKHVDHAGFMENRNFKNVYPITLNLNLGVFSKSDPGKPYPSVVVRQVGDSIVASCTCNHAAKKMCEHQGEIIYSIIEEKNFRIFFDDQLRHSILEQHAKPYGLENEKKLDDYFEIKYHERSLVIEPKIKGLIPAAKPELRNDLIPRQQSKFKRLAHQESAKKRILLISKHRYYNQLNFLLMEAETTKAGKVKNPIDNLDPIPLIWSSEDPNVLKFYTAIYNFQNKFTDDQLESDIDALNLIVKNPLNLEVFLHDRNISENVTLKSISPVNLKFLRPEVILNVFKKEPYYEITADLLVNDKSISFNDLTIKNDYFLFFKKTMYLIDNLDLMRVIKYFRSNNEIMLLHPSKYDQFLETVLAPLEQILKINYTFIKAATPVQLKEKDYTLSKIIYLQQEGSYVSITPVMAYGEIEVPLYSHKQIFDKDLNGNVFKLKRNLDAEERFISSIIDKHPEFREQLNEPQYFYLHKNKFLDADWFIETFEHWRNDNITILGFNELNKNNINPNKAKITVEIISGIDWYNAKLKVNFGEHQASLKQIHRSIRNKSKFVLLDDGSHGIIPDEWLAKIVQYFRIGEMNQDFITIPKINFSEVEELFGNELLSTEVQHEIELLKREFADDYRIPHIEVPIGLNTKLRNYQHQGLNWMNFLDDHNFGGCLADDMGLGKTIQVIAFILSQKEKHGPQPNLIVVPTSLLFNWTEEIEKFAPSLKIWKHYGPDRNKSTKAFENHDVILTTYGMLLSDIRFLKEFKFNYIFLDESQAIKNPNSERYKAARLLNARNRIVLTGTPVENNTFDIYGQLSFACPGLLGSKQFFKDTYAIPIDQFQYSKRAVELQEKIQPFVLRRTKKQVVKELPEKTEMLIYCEMDSEQRKIYESYEAQLREFIAANEENDIQDNSMHVLAGLTKLRQICNSPILLGDGHSGDNAVKIKVLLEQIENKSQDHKILVFSQFVGMLDLIKIELESKGIPFEYLTGQTKNRGNKVHNFQNNQEVRVFLISLKAGGVGLNLTAADYVYLVDPWWNPAAENQAIDRSYRIGQNKNVVAVRLICSNSIEEKIMKLQDRKSKLAQDLVQTENSFFNNLSKDELLGLL
ncbi:DEAD/DEAH box helicase [Sphingobacterium endophyticum]|uniref:DEAD/DEAH box helicase n=1 Tax=Sphingobacterium endophyticum TaxID=2546448 RepID=UPI0012E21A5C|nr:DEAD/DEAH box helicase [Sphingobacterium endophyticum]